MHEMVQQVLVLREKVRRRRRFVVGTIERGELWIGLELRLHAANGVRREPHVRVDEEQHGTTRLTGGQVAGCGWTAARLSGPQHPSARALRGRERAIV